jgi:hypothetical protein
MLLRISRSRGRTLARQGLLAVAWVAMLSGCIVPTSVKPESERTGDVRRSPDALAVSVIFSRDFSPEASNSLGQEMVACVTDGLIAAVPEVRLMSPAEAHRALFGLEPGGVLLRADTLPTLLARPETRRRASEIGLTHLIIVGGHTRQTGEPILLGPGVAGGANAGTRTTRLTASIFELVRPVDAPAPVVSAGAAGSRFLAAGVYPLPFVVAGIPGTESAACQALGAEVARVMRGALDDDRR